MSYSFDYPVRVGYVDTDKMGFVHNSNYFVYFEIGRTEAMRNLGISYKEMENKGVMIPLVEQYAKYHKPAFYDDRLTIRTKIEQMPKAKIRFDYFILRESDDGKEEMLCSGYNILAFVDVLTKKPLKCPDFVSKMLEKFCG